MAKSKKTANSAPKDLLALVARFDVQAEAYRSGRYNETQLRRDFLDQFWSVLKWDVVNEQGFAEAYRDVIHEDSIKVGGATKAPDYCFRDGGVRKFFVEAKKPSVSISTDRAPAYQLRRYAWSAKLAISVLTNFDEFAIYDTRVKPSADDPATTARIFHCTYKQLPEKWEWLFSILSKPAVLKGDFDKFAENTKPKHGTLGVDDAFLDEIENWRKDLATHLALRNSNLTEGEINYSVQQIIDRIIFLRICEDRGIEDYGRLLALCNGPNIYPRMFEIFEDADKRFNSGLFHFKDESGRHEPHDQLTPKLIIEDKPLRTILKRLYYPESPYEFSVLPADILGQVYERFLGKVIRLTKTHRAVVEEKPEVKKAGGVYYTPSHVVEYIVRHALGPTLTDGVPKQVAKLHVVDPACGSGSFLIAAYQYLLDWHKSWYTQNDPGRWAKGAKPAITRSQVGGWRLTIPERKRILLNNIFGVDIDAQAVEVTKLSLLLKVLEGESDQTIQPLFRMFHERALPDLGDNIKCGNSVIGSDFVPNRQPSLLETQEKQEKRVNVFDWDVQFPEVMRAGRFDVVIGNPPWISLTGRFRNEIYTDEEVSYLQQKFKGNTYMPNMYEYFISQGLALTRDQGFFSFIVPDRFGYNTQFVDLRRRIVKDATVVSLQYKVPFPGVVADTLIFVIKNAKAPTAWQIPISEHGRPPVARKQAEIATNPQATFEYYADKGVMDLVKNVASANGVSELGRLFSTTSGFGGKSELLTPKRKNAKQIPVLKGDCIGRYELRKKYWFPFAAKNLTGRTTDPDKLGVRPRILLRKTGDRIIAAFDDSGMFAEQSLYFLYNKQTEVSWEYVLGLLNSKVMSAYYRTKSLTNKKSMAQVKKVDLDQLPIRVVNLNVKNEAAAHEEISRLVKQIEALAVKKKRARTPADQQRIESGIVGAQNQIDSHVYKLYGLTDAEILAAEKEA